VKKVYLAKCSTPLICKDAFNSVIDTCNEKSYLHFNTYMIRTHEDLENVRKKFEQEQQPCNVELKLIVEENENGKDFTVSIFK